MKPLLELLKLSLLLQLGYVSGIHDFYERLPNGNDKYDFLKLETPIHFFSDKYDDIYINTNGIISFGLPFANFTNAPFPLEIPAIAPFYANVDTSSNNPASSIVYYKTKDEDLLFRETASIRSSFYEATDFEAVELVGAKWENVGHFNQNDEQVNSFEVIIICGAEETYVKFVYPRNGLNWLRGDTGESGLPDIRAQAGFVSEDGRHFLLQGSGTDKVKYLSESSNYDEVGSWLFRVGPIGYEDDVAQPDGKRSSTPEPRTCDQGGSHKCHLNAECHDSANGFCCHCRKHYIGNGYNCIKADAPLRITGTVRGTVGSEKIESQLQSYVVLTDGRSYTALSPVSPDLGVKLQFLQSIGGTIGWLFSKPTDSVYKNGYQITGGKFNHTITLRFEATGEQFYINQKYLGLNLWDQLSAEIELSGELPNIPPGTRLHINDFKEEYIYTSPDKITVVSRHNAKLGQQDNDIIFSVYQDISFEACPYTDNPVAPNSLAGSVKTSKITLSYEPRENAVRMGMLSKVSATDKQNPCYDGTSNCGDNTICVPTGEDTYECNCKNGYTYVPTDGSGREHCDDIDECRGVNICDPNARCINEQGGYTCSCYPGYVGNGYVCSTPEQTTYESEASYPTYDSRGSQVQYPTSSSVENSYSYSESYERENERYHTSDATEESQTPPQLSNQCDLCSSNAYCEYGVCVCRSGFHGNGHECKPQCGRDYEWDGDTCKPLTTAEEYEVRPFCTKYGCECSTGYKLIEYAYGQMCRLIDPDSDIMDEDNVACDIANNCSPFANCEFSDEANKWVCVCEAGYDGNGYDCIEKEVSCVDEDICDQHASCVYSEKARKSVCVCDSGYEGDGKFCQLAPECLSDEDCGHNSVCDEGGVCVCQKGYERDISDFCVLAGSCGGAYCAENAVCQWDHRQKVSYCLCPSGFVGDGIKVCKSLPPPCNVRNNCGLYATCVPNYRDPSVYECACNAGYFGDGFVCTPERNCANVPEMCNRDATCMSTTAGYECVCNQGFIGNGSSCTAARLESGFLFISQGVATVRIPFDGSRGRPIAMAQMAIGLDKDCAEGRVYWSDISTRTIQSSKYDGSDKKMFINEDILSPEGLAVDWISRRLYWTDSAKDTIEVASLDNSKLRTVIVNKYLVNPRGIAVDPHRGKLYWSDWNRDSPKIEWANLDGTERQVLVAAPKVQLPNSLDISLQSGDLCFADAGTHKIECVDTYTKQVHTIASDLSYPFGLAVSTDRFYWTDWTTKKIESVDFEGKRQKSIPTPLFGSHKMYGMTAITDRCPVFYSPCHNDNGHCSPGTICLASPRAQAGRVCKCAVDCDNVINGD